jgi:hypothetical protein
LNVGSEGWAIVYDDDARHLFNSKACSPICKRPIEVPSPEFLDSPPRRLKMNEKNVLDRFPRCHDQVLAKHLPVDRDAGSLRGRFLQ